MYTNPAGTGVGVGGKGVGDPPAGVGVKGLEVGVPGAGVALWAVEEGDAGAEGTGVAASAPAVGNCGAKPAGGCAGAAGSSGALTGVVAAAIGRLGDVGSGVGGPFTTTVLVGWDGVGVSVGGPRTWTVGTGVGLAGGTGLFVGTGPVVLVARAAGMPLVGVAGGIGVLVRCATGVGEGALSPTATTGAAWQAITNIAVQADRTARQRPVGRNETSEDLNLGCRARKSETTFLNQRPFVKSQIEFADHQ
jgi:hypothetical protein